MNLGVTLLFPCAEASLPEGCESLDTLRASSSSATSTTPAPCSVSRSGGTPLARCIISDASHPWMGGVARELGVPRLWFDGFCAFSSLCMRQMNLQRIFDSVVDDKRPVRVPGFPIDVEISRARSPDNFSGPVMKEFGEEILAESVTADDLVVNSFVELEPMFVDAYEAAIGKKIWTISPLVLTEAMPSTASTTKDANAVRCVNWLESKKPALTSV